MAVAAEPTDGRRNRPLHPSRLAACAVGLGLLVGACGGDATSTATPDGSPPPTPTETATPTESATPSAEPTPTATGTPAIPEPTAAAEPTPTPPPEEDFTLALAPDGLLMVDLASGSTVPFPFGTSQDDTLTALETILGPPAEQRLGNPECPNGEDWVAAWPETIQVAFSKGSFLTWSLRPGSTSTDMTGVGLGSTATDLAAAWNTIVFESTLGTEFFTGSEGDGLGGLLSGPTPGDVVTNLWAGPICAFR